MEIKKPYAVVQYNKFIKSVDRADQFLSYYSVLRKTIKWWKKKVVLYLLTVCSATLFYMQDTKYKQSKYKKFLHEVGRSWISEVQDRSESSSDDLQLSEKGVWTGPARQTVRWFQNTQTGKKLLVVGREKRSVLPDSVQCVLHIGREVKVETFVNSALFCFTKGLGLRSTIQWRTTRLSICSFWSIGLRSTICSVKLSARICSGIEHSKHLKRPVSGAFNPLNAKLNSICRHY